MALVDDLQSSLELAKKIVESTDMANPVKVTYAIKQLAKEAAVGEEVATCNPSVPTSNNQDMLVPLPV